VIFIQICRRPMAQSQNFYPDSKMTSKGIFRGPVEHGTPENTHNF
jgi:hypothetical protein